MMADSGNDEAMNATRIGESQKAPGGGDDYDVEVVLPEFARQVSISEETDNVDGSFDRHEFKGGNAEEMDQAMQEKVNVQQRNDIEIDKGSSSSSNIVRTKNQEKHLEVGESRKEYTCNCGKVFEKSTELAAHKRWTCMQVEKRLQCDICLVWFEHKDSLRRHRKKWHNGNFSCSRCHLRFHNRVKLTRHWMESHFDDNDKTLKCFVCGDESFKSKFDLESHLLAHKYERLENKKRREGGGTPINTHLGRGRGVEGHPKIITIDLTDTSSTTPTTKSDSKKSVHNPYYCGERQTSCTVSSKGESTVPPSLHHFAPPPSAHSNTYHPPPFSHHHPPPPPFPPSPPSHDHHHHHHSPSPHHPPPHHNHPSFPTHDHHPPHHHPSSSPPPPYEYDIHPHRSSPHRHHLHHAHHHRPPNPTNPPFWSNPEHPWYRKRCKWRHSHHHNKWKWKKYIKDMMCQYFFSPSTNYEPYPSSHLQSQSTNQHAPPLDLHSATTNHNPSPSTSSQIPDSTNPNTTTNIPAASRSELNCNDQTPISLQMVCTFCGQTIENGQAVKHRLQECPVICAFKCKVCNKVFRKHHNLLQHMNNHGHFFDTTSSTAASSTCSDTTSLVNLHEKLNSVLDFKTRVQSSVSPTERSEINEFQKLPVSSKSSDPSTSSTTSAVQQTKTYSILGTSRSRLTTVDEMSDSGIAEEASLVIDDLQSPLQSQPMFQCVVCRVRFDSISILSVHLQSHITHVSAVQKVHEWKERSFQYLSSYLGEDSSVLSSCPEPSTDMISLTTTDSSIQDIGSSYGNAATFSTLSTTAESSSVKADTLTDSDKWLKPHCKKMKNKKKRDLNETFPCEHCDENFAFKKGLSAHMKEKHKDKKSKLECPVCQKKFSWKKRGQFYERHLSSHYGVTIFKHKCDVCDKTFLEKCKLQAHMAAQHQAKELLHTCHVCSKGYSTKSSLTRHLRHHTGDKPHRCDMCSESFMEKRELIRHMATHTGTPAFVCGECGQGFTLKTSLDIHMKRKHSDQEAHNTTSL